MPSPSVLLRARLSRIRILQPLAHRVRSMLMFALLFWPGVRDPERGLVTPADGPETADTLAEASW